MSKKATAPGGAKSARTDRATLLEYDLISMSRLSAALLSALVRNSGARESGSAYCNGLADSSVRHYRVLHAVIMIGGLKKRNIKTADLAQVCEDLRRWCLEASPQHSAISEDAW
jgi:hypothetical protein